MCGRYSFEVSRKELVERYRLKESAYDYKEKEEIFPTNRSPIILPDENLVLLTWGFLSSFAQRPLINARGKRY